jgi:hypothetical protein
VRHDKKCSASDKNESTEPKSARYSIFRADTPRAGKPHWHAQQQSFALAVQAVPSRSLRESSSAVAFSEREALATPKLTRFPGLQSPEVLEKRVSDFISKLESYQSYWEAEERRQCPGPRDQEGLEDQDSMSQRPPASRPASRSPPDGQRITLPPVQLRDDPQQGGRQEERQQPRQHDGRGYSQILPSPQPTRTPLATTPGEDWRSGRPRELGVHSILNPSEPEGTPSSSRRVSSGNTESPLSTVGPTSHFGVSPTTGTPYTFPSHDTPSSTPPTQEGHHASSPHLRERRIATPRSLVARMNRSGQPPGSIDAQRSPFLPQRARIDSRTFSGESGQAASSEVPPSMPTPPERSQQQYGFPGPTLDRRISMPTMRAPERTPLSQSASPSIAPSSVNPGSPRNYSSSYPGGPPPPSSTPYYPGSTFAPRDVTQQGGGGLQYQGPSASGTEGPYTSAPPPSASMSAGGSSAGSSRQTSASDPVQILTITTSSGVYNVPVDVHQASRLADEKRARNAGASARFRQRRKEKEKEASTTIEKMQSQTRDLERRVREAEQERDFYRGERDRLRDVLYRTPETRHLAVQGPPSPQTIRSSSFHGPASQVPGPPPAPISFQQEQPPAERPARRRRTSTTGQFQSITYTLPPGSTLPPVQASYQGPPQPPTTLPPMRIDNSAPPASTPSLAPATSGGPPLPYAPFDPSRSGYERGWPSERKR